MTALPIPGAGDAFYLVDVSGWIHRVWHAAKNEPEFTIGGERCEVVRGVLRMLARLIRDRDPALLAIATEGRGECWRRAYWPAYKAGHEPLPDECREQVKRLWSVVQAMRIPILWASGFEADDAIAAATAKATAAGLRTVIVTRDKDLQQLVGPQVTCWDGENPGAAYGPPEVKAKWGVEPGQLADLLALAGDKTDGVPGVKGIGPKGAAELLAAHGSLFGVFAAPSWAVHSRWRKKLHGPAQTDAELSRELVGLRADAPIAWHLADARFGSLDWDRLLPMLIDLRLQPVADRLLDLTGAKHWREGTPRGCFAWLEGGGS